MKREDIELDSCMNESGGLNGSCIDRGVACLCMRC